jgi:hypothetical protein
LDLGEETKEIKSSTQVKMLKTFYREKDQKFELLLRVHFSKHYKKPRKNKVEKSVGKFVKLLNKIGKVLYVQEKADIDQYKV